MMISGRASEWTAEPLRLVAHWVPVCDADGRPHLEMRWELPAVEVPQVAQRTTGTSTAA